MWNRLRAGAEMWRALGSAHGPGCGTPSGRWGRVAWTSSSQPCGGQCVGQGWRRQSGTLERRNWLCRLGTFLLDQPLDQVVVWLPGHVPVSRGHDASPVAKPAKWEPFTPDRVVWEWGASWVSSFKDLDPEHWGPQDIIWLSQARAGITGEIFGQLRLG